MNIGKKSDNQEYNLCGSPLQTVESEKDIGVTVDCKLNFEEHVSEKVNKANKMFAVIRLSFQYLNERSFIPLYKALVRSHLDFASSVWAPSSVKCVEMIEGVQRRATKQLPGMKDLTYPERLERLRLPTLSYRRVRGDMIEVYKMLTGIYDTNATSCLKLWKDMAPRQGTRGHEFKLFPSPAKTSLGQNSFSVRVVKLWNSLPSTLVNAKTVNSFKNRLDRFWSNQDLVYRDFKAKITVTGSRQVTSNSTHTCESDEEELPEPVLETIYKRGRTGNRWYGV
jgi:ribonuclease P/MRP protein subunit RPP40